MPREPKAKLPGSRVTAVEPAKGPPLNIIRCGKVLPGYHDDKIPKTVSDNNWFRNPVVYSLPMGLLENVRSFAPKFFTNEEADFETALACIDERAVAFHNRQPVFSPWLLDYDGSFDRDSFVEMFGEESYNSVLELYEGPMMDIDLKVKAYLGWLVQQRDFQIDVESLCGTLASESLSIEQASASLRNKWRLQAFFTSQLPNPLTPQLSAANYYGQPDVEGGATPFVPDIFPIQGTGVVAEQLNQMRKNSVSAHLQGWWELTRKGAANNRPFEALARQYRLQHYWRILRQRYPSRTHRKASHFHAVFAPLFGVSEETIKRDFANLNTQSDILDIKLDVRF